MITFKVTMAQEDNGRLRMHTINIDAEDERDAYAISKGHFPEDNWFVLEVEPFVEVEDLSNGTQSIGRTD